MTEDAAAVSLSKPYTLTGVKRRAAMAAAVRRIDRDDIAGDVVECGVWRGGNIIIARHPSPSRVCWLYDTFTGMTEPGPEDLTRTGGLALERYQERKVKGGGWCEASVDDVVTALRATDTYDPQKVRFVVGPVEQTLVDPSNLPDRIALLRLDTDWYASTKVELEVLYPRLVKGGVLIVDDYGHWMGARKAVDEYFAGSPLAMERIDYTAVMMVKPC